MNIAKSTVGWDKKELRDYIWELELELERCRVRSRAHRQNIRAMSRKLERRNLIFDKNQLTEAILALAPKVKCEDNPAPKWGEQSRQVWPMDGSDSTYPVWPSSGNTTTTAKPEDFKTRYGTG